MSDLVFIHGWGMNSQSWQPLIAELPDYNHHTIDLGFIAGGKTTWQDTSRPAIYIGHSLGIMWLLKQWRESKDTPSPTALISIAGFACFNSFTDPRQIALMQRGLSRNPDAQMAHFRRSAGCIEDAEGADLNTKNLGEGLSWLAEWDERETLETIATPTLALASKLDKIVPEAATRSQWEEGNTIWHETAPHCLHQTAPSWCAAEIISFIKRR